MFGALRIGNNCVEFFKATNEKFTNTCKWNSNAVSLSLAIITKSEFQQKCLVGTFYQFEFK